MPDLLPYLCPFADCDLKDKMWGVRSEWETHLNDQHPIPNAQGGDTNQCAYTCKICRRGFNSHGNKLRKESYDRFCFFRNSHYANHMERIASSVMPDYGPLSSTSPRRQNLKPDVKRRRRRNYRSGLHSGHDSSSSGHDEEAISGWSSEGSTGSQG